MEVEAKRAVIYLRVSTDMQAEHGTSLETQELACHRKAREIGAVVYATRTDAGVSGGLYLTRAGIQAALCDLESGAANILLVAKLDRAGRDVDALRDIASRVSLAGGQLIFADGMNFGNNATGRLMFTQLAGFAEYERGVIRERTMSGRVRKAEAGHMPNRSKSPYGYKIVQDADVVSGRRPIEEAGKYEVVEYQADIVRVIFQKCADGTPLRAIARYLTSQGIRTPKDGTEWAQSSLQKMLRNPAYKGEAQFGRMTTLRDESRSKPTPDGKKEPRNIKYDVRSPDGRAVTIPCPAIVDADTWERCQERLRSNKAEQSGNPERSYLLGGYLLCPCCGGKAAGKMRDDSKRNRYYVCAATRRGKGDCRFNIHVGIVEKWVTEGIFTAANDIDLWRMAVRAYDTRQQQQSENRDTDAERTRIQAELDTLDKRTDAVTHAQIEAIGAGLPTATYLTALKGIDEKRKPLQTRIASLAPAPIISSQYFLDDAAKVVSVIADVQEVFNAPELTTAERRGVLGVVVKQVRMLPDMSGAEIDLRTGHSVPCHSWKRSAHQRISLSE